MNRDIKTRDKIIFGEYDPDRYCGGCRGFRGMSLDALKYLVEFDFVDKDERQNNSPSVSEFISFMEKNGGYVLNGYVVSDKRADYRVSIESIESEKPLKTFNELAEFVSFARCADEFSVDGFAWWD